MKSRRLGKSTSGVEVLNISTHGLWLYVKGKEYFLPYEEFPWFRDATLSQVQDVKLLHNHHLHWERLDVNIDLDSLKCPERYPLKYQ